MISIFPTLSLSARIGGKHINMRVDIISYSWSCLNQQKSHATINSTLVITSITIAAILIKMMVVKVISVKAIFRGCWDQHLQSCLPLLFVCQTWTTFRCSRFTANKTISNPCICICVWVLCICTWIVSSSLSSLLL